MKFNINDAVRVRLTDKGRKILRLTQYGHLPEEDETGWSEWQLWTLMEKFGGALHDRAAVPFDTTIEIIEPHSLSGDA